MSRTNLVLLILLALQGGIVLLQLVGGRGDEAVQAGPFLDGLSVAAVQEMTLSDGDSAVTLRRTATGWGVVENDLYPASADKTGELLQELVAISTREMISRSSAHHVDLEVAEAAFNRRVRVEAGEQTHTIYVGKAGPGGSTYVRREGEDDVFSVSDFSPHKLSARPEAWLERVVFEAERDQIFAIDVHNSGGDFRLERRTLTGWQLAGAPPGVDLDNNVVDKVLGKVASVRLKEVAGLAAEVDFGPPVAEVTIHVSTQPLPAADPLDGDAPEPVGAAHTLRIVAVSDDAKTFLMRLDDAPHVVETTSWSVEPLLATTASQLLGE